MSLSTASRGRIPLRAELSPFGPTALSRCAGRLRFEPMGSTEKTGPGNTWHRRVRSSSPMSLVSVTQVFGPCNPGRRSDSLRVTYLSGPMRYPGTRAEQPVQVKTLVTLQTGYMGDTLVAARTRSLRSSPAPASSPAVAGAEPAARAPTRGAQAGGAVDRADELDATTGEVTHDSSSIVANPSGGGTGVPSTGGSRRGRLAVSGGDSSTFVAFLEITPRRSSNTPSHTGPK